MLVAEAYRRIGHLKLTLLLLCLAAMLMSCQRAVAAESANAVILLYHHVSDRTPRPTSISPDTFEHHLDYLAGQGYTVLPLEEIVRALTDGTSLAPNAVGITFDDGYESIYTEALPRLERRGWPFTVFVSTLAIDHAYANFMTWDELRDLESRGGTIANHSVKHTHLIRREDAEEALDWRRRVSDDILTAQARLDAELERPSRLFAYPYGEFDAPLEAVIADLDLVAFGQQSGPIGSGSNVRQLARFPLATGYDSILALAEKLRTRPLPVELIAPESRVLPAGSAAPSLQFRLADGPYRRDALRCYVAGQDPASITWDGDVATVRAQRQLKPGRGKYNCTAPSASDSGVFYWYSHLWIQPLDDGSWYAE